MARLVPNVPDPNKKAIISSEYLAKNSHFRGNVDRNFSTASYSHFNFFSRDVEKVDSSSSLKNAH